LLAAVAMLPVAAAEVLHAGASGRLLTPPRSDEGPTEAILVLGYPCRPSGELHPLQRWRTEIAVRSMDPGKRSRLVFSGFAGRPGLPAEAEAMGAYARTALGVPADQIVLDTAARTTRQNVELNLDELLRADVIKVASDPMHAARARAYLVDLHPEVADRLRRTDDYRIGERWQWKVALAAREVALPIRRRLRARRRERIRATATSGS
jgi:DUF218 domain